MGRGLVAKGGGIGRRTEGPFAPRRLRRAERNPPSLAQPVAGALSHGLHFDWREAGLRPCHFKKPILKKAEGTLNRANPNSTRSASKSPSGISDHEHRQLQASDRLQEIPPLH